MDVGGPPPRPVTWPVKHIDVAGEALADFLGSNPPRGCLVRIEPPPASWRPLKPLLFARGHAQGAGPDPPVRFLSYPLCGIGREYPMLATVAEPNRPAPEACSRCSRRASCSPPSRWTRELQPFGPLSPGELWRSYHRNFCEAVGVPYEVRADAIVDRLLELKRFDRRPFPFVLEPSVRVAHEFIAELRLVTFHGPLPPEPAVAARRTRHLLYLFARIHQDLDWPVPKRLVSTLSSFSPFPFPVGFAMSEAHGLGLKSYVRMEHFGGERKQALFDALARVATGHLRYRPTHWETVDMLGLVSSARGLEQLKAYVRAEPTAAHHELGLAALRADDPAVALSGGRAYGVVDAIEGSLRPNKWDLSTRTELLSGPVVADLCHEWLPKPAARQLSRLVDHQNHRIDLVAIGRRAETWTFYVELS